MIAITTVFFLCVAPYFLFFLYPGNQDFKEAYLPYIVMVMYLNSLNNPLINTPFVGGSVAGQNQRTRDLNPKSTC